jgi:hypothetical protein
MTRRLLNLLTALSRLLGVAIVVLWVRGFWRGSRLHLSFGGATPAGVSYTRWTVEAESGRVVVQRETLAGTASALEERTQRWRARLERPIRLESGPPIIPQGRTMTYVLESLWDFASGTAAAPVPPAGRMVASYVLFPHWLPLVPVGAPAACWAWRRWTSRRWRRRGACRRCGYDLRATPGRCPECGAPHEVLPHRPAGSQGQ